jgi:hypothetical protein
MSCALRDVRGVRTKAASCASTGTVLADADNRPTVAGVIVIKFI